MVVIVPLGSWVSIRPLKDKKHIAESQVLIRKDDTQEIEDLS